MGRPLLAVPAVVLVLAGCGGGGGAPHLSRASPAIARLVLGTAGADNVRAVDGFLLVDDRDGRVLAEITDPVEAFRLLDEIKEDHPELAGALCLVKFEGKRGSLIATDTTTRVRTLDWNRV